MHQGIYQQSQCNTQLKITTRFNINLQYSLILIISLCMLPFISSANSADREIFTYMAPHGINDTRYLYEKQLLALALNLTKAQYGDFKLIPSQPNISVKQTESLAKNGHFENFFLKFSYSDALANKLLAVPFPIDRGIAGYRISLIAQSNQPLLKNVQSTQQLKNKTIVQGVGWLDSNILSANGLSVFTIANYNKMFEMVANERAELFFRGIHEWLNEYKIMQKNQPNLSYDKHIALQYPLPRFFFTSQGNHKNAQRVQQGLLKAYQTGQLQKLWRTHYAKSIQASQLSARQLIKLKNPYIKNLGSDYQKYNFTMQELKQIENVH